MRPLGHRRGGNREAVDVLVASAEENRASPGSLWFMPPSPNAELDLGRARPAKFAAKAKRRLIAVESYKMHAFFSQRSDLLWQMTGRGHPLPVEESASKGSAKIARGSMFFVRGARLGDAWRQCVTRYARICHRTLPEVGRPVRRCDGWPSGPALRSAYPKRMPCSVASRHRLQS
jgi:hypothetical protein